MTKLSCLLAVTSVALFTPVLTACDKGPQPENVCDDHLATRKKDAWPADAEIKTACVKELSALKKKDEKAFGELAGCLRRSAMRGPSGVNQCLALKGDPYAYGFAADASGAWAQGTPKKLSEEACNEGAYVIARRKLELHILKDEAGQKAHEVELAKACTQSKDDPLYASMYACMRRATKSEELMKCAGTDPSAGPDGTSASVIEACVSDCTKKHGRDASAAYMSCFDGCKAKGGP